MGGAAAADGEVSALARGLCLLQTLAVAQGELTNRQLAERAGIPKATVSRLTGTLAAGGYVRRSAATDGFSLGPALLELGTAYLRTIDFRSLLRPHLAELADRSGATVNCGVREGSDIVIVDSYRPAAAVLLSSIGVGSRLSIRTSAAGRAHLASLPPDEQAGLLRELRAGQTGWTAVRSRLERAIAEYARDGSCSSFGEWHPDIHALGFASAAGSRPRSRRSS